MDDNKDFNYWKEYRKNLTEMLKEKQEKLEKTPENIYNMAKKSGVKPTARYFNIQPVQVRYYIKKFESEKAD